MDAHRTGAGVSFLVRPSMPVVYVDVVREGELCAHSILQAHKMTIEHDRVTICVEWEEIARLFCDCGDVATGRALAWRLRVNELQRENLELRERLKEEL